MKYVVIFEWGTSNWSAYSPDVPGCIATGKDREETAHNFRAALISHFEVMREFGETIPQPTCEAGYIEVPQAVAAGH